jgi:transposase
MEMLPVALRARVVTAYLQGEGSYQEIADRFLVSAGFVHEMVRRFLATGRLEPAPHGGGCHRLGVAGERALVTLIAQRPDATLGELRTGLSQITGVSLTLSGLYRATVRLGLTYKKSRSELPNKGVKTSRSRASHFGIASGGGLLSGMCSSMNSG